MHLLLVASCYYFTRSDALVTSSFLLLVSQKNREEDVHRLEAIATRVDLHR